MKPLKIIQLAELELAKETAWYRDRDPRVASRLTTEVRKTLKLIETFPQIGGQVSGINDPGVRSLPVNPRGQSPRAEADAAHDVHACESRDAGREPHMRPSAALTKQRCVSPRLRACTMNGHSLCSSRSSGCLVDILYSRMPCMHLSLPGICHE